MCSSDLLLYFGLSRTLLIVSCCTTFILYLFISENIHPLTWLTGMSFYFSSIIPDPFKFDSEEDDLSISQTLQQTGSDKR